MATTTRYTMADVFQLAESEESRRVRSAINRTIATMEQLENERAEIEWRLRSLDEQLNLLYMQEREEAERLAALHDVELMSEEEENEYYDRAVTVCDAN